MIETGVSPHFLLRLIWQQRLKARTKHKNPDTPRTPLDAVHDPQRTDAPAVVCAADLETWKNRGSAPCLDLTPVTIGHSPDLPHRQQTLIIEPGKARDCSTVFLHHQCRSLKQAQFNHAQLSWQQAKSGLALLERSQCSEGIGTLAQGFIRCIQIIRRHDQGLRTDLVARHQGQ